MEAGYRIAVFLTGAGMPGRKPSRLGLAETLANSGKKKLAMTEYEEVLRQKPQYEAARVALEKLRLSAPPKTAP